MKCIFCGGKVKKEKVTFVYEEKEKYIFIENVPAEVCPKCGEKTFSPEVTQEILKFAKNEFTPVKTVEIPVFNFECSVK
ncbi:MAG: type II toxin-antitoxin system MqsA family antitoxin [Candidatus Eremiobacterota bacterium]